MSVAYSIIPGNITRLLLFFLKYIYIFLDIGDVEMMRVMRGSVSLRVAESDVGT